VPVRRVGRVAAAFLGVGIILLLLQLRGCKRGWVIFPEVAIRNEGDMIAFVAGPQYGKRPWPELSRARVFVLDLSGNVTEPTEIKETRGARGLAWRPSVSPAELYVVTFDFAEAEMRDSLMRITVGRPPSVVRLQYPGDDCIASFNALGWSPSGTVLAITDFRSGEFRGRLTNGEFRGRLTNLGWGLREAQARCAWHTLPLSHRRIVSIDAE